MSQIVSSISIDDSDTTNVTYSGTTWTRNPSIDPSKGYYDNTESYTGVTGATATLHFYGTGVEYWGDTWNDHGPCDLSIDGSGVGTITAYSADPSGGPPTILYSVDNLTLGDHTFTIRVAGTNPDTPICEIDRFVVITTSSDTSSAVSSGTLSAIPSDPSSITFPSSTTSSDGPTPSSQSKASISTGAIAGLVVGGIGVLCLLILLIIWGCTRHSKRKKEWNQNVLASPPMANMEIQGNPVYYNYSEPAPYHVPYHPASASMSGYHAFYPPPTNSIPTSASALIPTPMSGYHDYYPPRSNSIPNSASALVPTSDSTPMSGHHASYPPRSNSIPNSASALISTSTPSAPSTSTGPSPPPEKATYRRSEVLSFSSGSTSARAPVNPTNPSHGSSVDPPAYEKGPTM